MRAVRASVNAPRSWPNNSDSASDSGMRRAVHFDKRLGRARPALMQPARNGRFARARFALNQHRRQLRLHPRVRVENFFNCASTSASASEKENRRRLGRVAAPLFVQSRARCVFAARGR
jgi:hypothetical protein